MLDQVLATFTEGVVIYLGLPLLLKLCQSIFGSISPEFDLHVAKCALLKRHSTKKVFEDNAETQDSLVCDVQGYTKLQSESSPSIAHGQGCHGFTMNDKNKLQCVFYWSHCMMNKTKSDKGQKEDHAPLFIHDVDGSAFVNFSVQHNTLKGLCYDLDEDDTFAADGIQVSCGWRMMSDAVTMMETSECCESREDMADVGSNMLSLEMFPDDTCDLDEICISDCVYNRKGQLVGMYICFNVAHSDTSSVTSSKDSTCNMVDSDCEDFIVFENSDSDDDQLCPRVDFVCDTCELNEETCMNPTVLTSNTFYNEADGMGDFDAKVDSCVLDILKPNLQCNYDNLILKTNRLRETSRSNNNNHVSVSTSGKTMCKEEMKKKVHFKPDDQLATIHHLIVWNFAYRQARKGTWRADALDRLRFQRKVVELDKILTPILMAKKGQIK